MDYALIREFKTPNFRVVVRAEEENDLDLSWDEDGQTAEGLNNGTYVAFCAHAYVQHRETGAILANDYLGGCIYKSIAEFEDHRECGKQTAKLRAEGSSAIVGSYFADMVKTVCQEARERLAGIQGIKVRK